MRLWLTRATGPAALVASSGEHSIHGSSRPLARRLRPKFCMTRAKKPDRSTGPSRVLELAIDDQVRHQGKSCRKKQARSHVRHQFHAPDQTPSLPIPFLDPLRIHPLDRQWLNTESRRHAERNLLGPSARKLQRRQEVRRLCVPQYELAANSPGPLGDRCAYHRLFRSKHLADLFAECHDTSRNRLSQTKCNQCRGGAGSAPGCTTPGSFDRVGTWRDIRRSRCRSAPTAKTCSPTSANPDFR